jgi:hypothetical protein
MAKHVRYGGGNIENLGFVGRKFRSIFIEIE